VGGSNHKNPIGRLFAAHPLPPGDRPLLPELAELVDEKRQRYENLLSELIELRDSGMPAVPQTPHPLRFPAGQDRT